MAGTSSSVRVSIKIEGVELVEKGINKTRSQLEKGFERGMKEAGRLLLRESQKIVPVDTGALRASGRVRSEGKGVDIEVIVSYSTWYAIYVHEILWYYHKPPTQAKFLETPFRRLKSRLIDIIKKEINILTVRKVK